MKSACIRLPKWVKETLALIREFASALTWCALGVITLTLIALGFTSLLGLSAKNALELYTPLLLGLFSIGITLYLFQRNIREGRERSKQERDQAVRPILALTMLDAHAPARGRVDFELAYPNPTADDEEINYDEKWLEIENIGVGPALDIQIIALVNFKYCKVGGTIDVLKEGAKKFINLKLMIPKDSIEDLFTVYNDVYENSHACAHALMENEVDG